MLDSRMRSRTPASRSRYSSMANGKARSIVDSGLRAIRPPPAFGTGPLCTGLADGKGVATRIVVNERKTASAGGDFVLASAGFTPNRQTEIARFVEENGVYATYTSKDGVVIIGIQNEREWAVFCDKVLGDPVLPSDPRFNANAKRNENRAAPDAVLDRFHVVKALNDAHPRGVPGR